MMQKYLLLLPVLALALSANAQSNYGVVKGTVTDPQHLPVVGAALQMKAVSTGATRHLVTNQRRARSWRSTVDTTITSGFGN